MAYTLGDAAKATGKSKTTLQRAIKKGTFSASRHEDGSYSIDPAELHRVYPPVSATGHAERDMKQDATPSDTIGLHTEVEVLRQQLALINHEREREREQLADQIEDLRKRLDQTNEERRDKDRQLTALLSAPKNDAPGPSAGGGFWRIFGRQRV